MDISKRQFLQKAGILTAGAALVPVADAGLTLKPVRREGSAKQRYAMLIDLRRCIAASPVLSVAPPKTRRRRVSFARR